MVYDGPLKLQKEEVDSVHFMSMEEILQRYSNGEPFTPDSIHACQEYVKLKGYLTHSLVTLFTHSLTHWITGLPVVPPNAVAKDPVLS
jgi:hypothetical protein